MGKIKFKFPNNTLEEKDEDEFISLISRKSNLQLNDVKRYYSKARDYFEEENSKGKILKRYLLHYKEFSEISGSGTYANAISKLVILFKLQDEINCSADFLESIIPDSIRNTQCFNKLKNNSIKKLKLAKEDIEYLRILLYGTIQKTKLLGNDDNLLEKIILRREIGGYIIEFCTENDLFNNFFNFTALPFVHDITEEKLRKAVYYTAEYSTILDILDALKKSPFSDTFFEELYHCISSLYGSDITVNKFFIPINRIDEDDEESESFKDVEIKAPESINKSIYLSHHQIFFLKKFVRRSLENYKEDIKGYSDIIRDSLKLLEDSRKFDIDYYKKDQLSGIYFAKDQIHTKPAKRELLREKISDKIYQKLSKREFAFTKEDISNSIKIQNKNEVFPLYDFVYGKLGKVNSPVNDKFYIAIKKYLTGKHLLSLLVTSCNKSTEDFFIHLRNAWICYLNAQTERRDVNLEFTKEINKTTTLELSESIKLKLIGDKFNFTHKELTEIVYIFSEYETELLFIKDKKKRAVINQEIVQGNIFKPEYQNIIPEINYNTLKDKKFPETKQKIKDCIIQLFTNNSLTTLEHFNPEIIETLIDALIKSMPSQNKAINNSEEDKERLLGRIKKGISEKFNNSKEFIKEALGYRNDPLIKELVAIREKQTIRSIYKLIYNNRTRVNYLTNYDINSVEDKVYFSYFCIIEMTPDIEVKINEICDGWIKKQISCPITITFDFNQGIKFNYVQGTDEKVIISEIKNFLSGIQNRQIGNSGKFFLTVLNQTKDFKQIHLSILIDEVLNNKEIKEIILNQLKSIDESYEDMFDFILSKWNESNLAQELISEIKSPIHLSPLSPLYSNGILNKAKMKFNEKLKSSKILKYYYEKLIEKKIIIETDQEIKTRKASGVKTLIDDWINKDVNTIITAISNITLEKIENNSPNIYDSIQKKLEDKTFCKNYNSTAIIFNAERIKT